MYLIVLGPGILETGLGIPVTGLGKPLLGTWGLAN